MTALIVFESMFGSTRAVAEAVAEGVRSEGEDARVVEVGELAGDGGGLPDDVTLLLVGGPTHAFSMSRESTRADAARQAHGPLVSQGVGVREWLEGVDLPPRLPWAVFDTKVDKPFLPGSAAKAASKRLGARGGVRVVPPRSFKVLGTTEGLVDGELDEARRWGADVVQAAGVVAG